MSPPGATARLSRLLAMVPWLLRRQGVPLAEAAEHFGISTDQLVKDLELLFVCGTPGHYPDDLIDASWDSGRIFLDNADAIARPLRLGVDEAVALLAGLRTLADVPGLHDRDVLDRVMAKLATAAGDAAEAAGAVQVDLARGAHEGHLAGVRAAIADVRRLRLTYVVPSRDETTRREVDPIRLFNVGDRWYLTGWCHQAEAVRHFRLDRVAALEVLDVDGTPPPQARDRSGVGAPEGPGGSEDLFTPSADDLVAVVDLAPEARWVCEYYRVEDPQELPDGTLRVRVRSASQDWLARLALRLGGGLRVVSPPELAGQVRDLASRALAEYICG